MKRFICKLLLLAAAFVTLNVLLLCIIPKDRNAYLCAYNHKIRLLEITPQPRKIFIGGSSIAFGTDSKTIGDSLHCQVVNFGLHGGIGIRYPLEDGLQYVQKGDTVILQIEYENFFTGGNGEAETFLSLMLATDWRNIGQLNAEQWINMAKDLPKRVMASTKRALKYPFRKSFDSPQTNPRFQYVASGFNEYGDEISHFNYPNEPYYPTGKRETREIKRSFMDWLSNTIRQYEQAGATVLLLPPVCIASRFQESYNDRIAQALSDIGHPYIVSPASMVLEDRYTFNSGYHVNQEGCELNTQHIIRALRSIETH